MINYLNTFKRDHVSCYNNLAIEVFEQYYSDCYGDLDECILEHAADEANGMIYNELFKWAIYFDNSPNYINDELDIALDIAQINNNNNIDIYNIMSAAYEKYITEQCHVCEYDIVEYAVVCIICDYIIEHNDEIDKNKIGSPVAFLNNLLESLMYDLYNYTGFYVDTYDNLKIDAYELIDDYLLEL